MSESLFSFDDVPDQKGIRWFVQRGEDQNFSRGFKSKSEASEWINDLGRRLDWRAGFHFRLRGDKFDMKIISRSGEVAKI